MTKTKRKQRPEPKDLKTHQRLAMTGRAVAQGVKRTIQRKHDSQEGKRELVTEAQLKRILKDWPAPAEKYRRSDGGEVRAPERSDGIEAFLVANFRGPKMDELNSAER